MRRSRPKADFYIYLHQTGSVRLLSQTALITSSLAPHLCQGFADPTATAYLLDLVPLPQFQPNSSSLTFWMQVIFTFFVILHDRCRQKTSLAIRDTD